MQNESIIKLFYNTEKIDNIPIILQNPEKIIEHFEFALRIDPFLFIQLLNYSNLEGYGFYNKINRIEEIPLILDHNVLYSVIKSASKFKMNGEWENIIIYYLMIYPVYLSITEIINDPLWLNEYELNTLTLSSTGFALKKFFFKNEFDEINQLSIVKNMTFIAAESLLEKPVSSLIINAFFSNKKIPAVIPSISPNSSIDTFKGKIAFILELTDILLKTNFYINKNITKCISDYMLEKIKINIGFEEWFNILSDKMTLLFGYLLSENIKDKVFSFIKNCYDRENKREKNCGKVTESLGDAESTELEEIK